VTGDRGDEINCLLQVCYKEANAEGQFTDFPCRPSTNSKSRGIAETKRSVNFSRYVLKSMILETGSLTSLTDC
jgi:hypothetical protein